MLLTKKERVVIVGCGRFGGRLAARLSDKGYQVVIIDNRQEAFGKLPDSFSGFPIQADGTNLETLEYAEIEDASVFVAATGNDNINNLCAQIAARIYGVPHVYVRFDDITREKLISGFNIQGIYPFKLSLAEIEESLFGESTVEEDFEE